MQKGAKSNIFGKKQLKLNLEISKNPISQGGPSNFIEQWANTY